MKNIFPFLKMANKQGLFDQARSMYNSFMGYEMPRNQDEPRQEIPKNADIWISRGEPRQEMPRNIGILINQSGPNTGRGPVFEMPQASAPVLETFGDYNVRSFKLDSNTNRVLEITVSSGEFRITPSNDNNVNIKMNGTKKQISDYDIIQEGSRIIIEQKRTGGYGGNVSVSNVTGVSGSGNVIRGNNIVIGSGNVIGSGRNNSYVNQRTGQYRNACVNGVYYDHNGNPQSGACENLKPVIFEISIPSNMDYEIKLMGKANLKSQVLYKKLYLSLSDKAVTVFSGGGDSKIKLNDHSNCNIDDINGSLEGKANNKSIANVVGNFSFVDISTSDKSIITTQGDCSGDYYAKAHNKSRIIHKGKIYGRKQIKPSDKAKIYVD